MRALIATDGSACAAVAVDLAAELGWPEGTLLHVVQVVEAEAGLLGGPWPAVEGVDVAAIEADLLAAAQRTVAEASQRLSRSGVRVESEVLRGRPATQIVSAASSMRAGLIIVGSRGHGTIESMILGSVSAEVVDHATIPVLVARGHRAGPCILAWDGSAGASAAADRLRDWPLFQRQPVRVVSVTDPEIPWWSGIPEIGAPGMGESYADAIEETRRALEASAQTIVRDLRRAGVDATGEMREGDAASEILRAARDRGAGLILMGSRGRTGLARVLMGSVARNVLHHAPCSVLIVRQAVPA